MNYLSIDVGTTRCKCQLFSPNGEILEYLFFDYQLKTIDNFSYVNIDAIKKYLLEMIKKVSSKHQIASVCVSSLGESFVLLDEDDNVLFYPMLYTDTRGEEQVKLLNEAFSDEYFLITGTCANCMYSIAKLLYIKENYPELYKKANKLMLIGDYIGYLLTGERVIDYALASRTGAFDIEKKEFSKQILNKFDIDISLFSTPKIAGSIVGKIKKEWGIDAELVLGSHDQVCTALGAGVIKAGQAVDGLGTVECITTLFDKRITDINMGKQGYACVPYAIDGRYCTYILNYSCGSTVNWLREKIMHGYSGEEKDYFAYMEKRISLIPTGIITIPYFGGASTPYQNANAKGAIINLTTQTDDSVLYQSVMEGTAMEMALNGEVVEKYGVCVKEIVATGGCSNSDKWMQIKADIQNIPVRVLRSHEGGLCGCAMLQAVALKKVKNFEEAKEIFVRYTKEFTPKNSERYKNQYEKYKKTYRLIKELY